MTPAAPFSVSASKGSGKLARKCLSCFVTTLLKKVINKTNKKRVKNQALLESLNLEFKRSTKKTSYLIYFERQRNAQGEHMNGEKANSSCALVLQKKIKCKKKKCSTFSRRLEKVCGEMKRSWVNWRRRQAALNFTSLKLYLPNLTFAG